MSGTIGFVKTSVLSSKDGVDYADEKRFETADKEASTGRKTYSGTLYDQLQAQKDLKQQEYDAKTKSMYGAPPSLDEEDVEYLESIAEQKKLQRSRLADQDASQIANFALEQASQVVMRMQKRSEIETVAKQTEDTSTSSNHINTEAVIPRKKEETRPPKHQQQVFPILKRRKLNGGKASKSGNKDGKANDTDDKRKAAEKAKIQGETKNTEEKVHAKSEGAKPKANDAGASSSSSPKKSSGGVLSSLLQYSDSDSGSGSDEKESDKE